MPSRRLLIIPALVLPAVVLRGTMALFAAGEVPGWAVGTITWIALLHVGTFLVLFSGSPFTDRRSDATLFVVAYVVRSVMAVLVYSFGLVRILGDYDATLWVFARDFAYQERGNDLITCMEHAVNWVMQRRAAGGGYVGYQALLALFFHFLGGSSRLAAAFLNSWFGAMTVVLTARIGTELFGSTAGRYAGLLACAMPSLIIWSAQTLKEPVVIFFEVLCLYSALRLRQHLLWRHVLSILLALLLLFSMRSYAAWAVGISAGLFLVTARGRVSVRLRIVAIALVLLLAPLLSGSALLQKDLELARMFDINFVRTFRYNVSHGEGSGSGIKGAHQVQNTFQLVLATLVGAFHLMFAPFPWQWGKASVRMLLTVPEVIMWWILFAVAVIPGLRVAYRMKPPGLLALLFFGASLGLVYSMLFANIGLIYRQRAQLLPILLVLAGVGIAVRVRRRARIWSRQRGSIAPSWRVMPRVPLQ